MGYLNFLGRFTSLEEAKAAHGDANAGDYLYVGNDAFAAVYYWDDEQQEWARSELSPMDLDIRDVDSVYGDLHVHHDLSVGGILRARVVRGRNAFCGLFYDEISLIKAYPYPYVGQWALVEIKDRPSSANIAIGEVYVCREDGKWEDAGYGGGLLYEALDASQVNNLENFKAYGSSLFLSKKDDDAAAGLIRFLKGLKADELATFLGGLEVDGVSKFSDELRSKEVKRGLYDGRGWYIDANGWAQFAGLSVQNLEVLELIINRLRAIDGDVILTENDTIERVEKEDGGIYRLYLKDKWEGYLTAQCEGNILKGVFNALPSMAAGLTDVDAEDCTEGDGRNVYFTSWMHVLGDDADGVHVEPGNNYVRVRLYEGADVPGGRNFAPCAMMTLARFGNTDPDHADRQNFWYITKERAVRYTGVTKPLLSERNYGSSYGLPPSWLLEKEELKGRIGEDDDVVFIDKAVISNFVQYDKEHKPVVQRADYATWESGRKYYFEDFNEVTGVFEVSYVCHYGCIWQCLKTGTTQEPKWNSRDWQLSVGDPDYHCEIVSTNGKAFRRNDVDTSLKMTVRHGNRDITEELTATVGCTVTWTRDTGRPADDNGWRPAYEGGYRSEVRITTEDMDTGWMVSYRRVTFTCRVVIPDGEHFESSFVF